MNYKDNYDFWIKNVKSKRMKTELVNMNEEQKNASFFKDIEFGTAGMRGIVGAGSNAMNTYTVGRVTEAISKYMAEKNLKSVAISYDTRNKSLEFAKLAAKIFAVHGIQVYLADKCMPTPFLSYMVRFYKCDFGVMITASHNPKDYNGYKVYGSDGCQLLEEPSFEIMKIAESIGIFEFKTMSYNKAVQEGLIKFIDDKILDSYIKTVKKQSLHKIKNITAVYTALNGTGINTLPQVLTEQGANIVFNKTQCKPDKNFTTCPKPNPEYDEVYDSSLKIAKKINADFILASDPDADRVGVCVNQNGEFVHLTGNEIGVLLTDYLFSQKQEKGGYLVKSIVTTSLAERVAAKYGGKTKNVLTGFKYIGEFITNLERDGKEKEFVLGFEESSGYLAGSYVRDKDATVACMLIAELASELKKQGKTIYDRLTEIYEEFGYYQAKVYSYRFEGASGYQKMQDLLKGLRTNGPKDFGGIKVVSVTDYSKGVSDLPKADVLTYELEGGASVVVRPSGTEPIIKNYVSLNKTKEENKANFEKVKSSLDKIFN